MPTIYFTNADSIETKLVLSFDQADALIASAEKAEDYFIGYHKEFVEIYNYDAIPF